jgi:hypothetical protein
LYVLSSISATIVQNSGTLRNDWNFATPGLQTTPRRALGKGVGDKAGPQIVAETPPITGYFIVACEISLGTDLDSGLSG